MFCLGIDGVVTGSGDEKTILLAGKEPQRSTKVRSRKTYCQNSKQRATRWAGFGGGVGIKAV